MSIDYSAEMQQELEELTVAKYKCLDSLMFFTRYFFKKRFNRKFVQGAHHHMICDALEKVLRGEITKLIINIAPRYGKTELAVKNFIAHALALNPSAKFIHLSYAADLAGDNSEEVRDMVQHEDFQKLFPEVVIKKDTKAKKKWYTTAGGGVYAVAAAGQVTGFGAGKVDEDEDEKEMDEWLDGIYEGIQTKEKFSGAIIIDDPIKPEDADSEIKRKRVNERFDSTIRNRVNSRNTPIIIIMQRLHEDDLCGYLINTEPDEWTVLSIPSINEDGTALWPFKHTIEELKKMQAKNPVVFGRQHMQDPQPLEGRLYKVFRTYKSLPPTAVKVKSVTDTADLGTDYLCNIIYSPTTIGYYLLDVYYTIDGMEVTEDETARRLLRFNAEKATIESNNGGRGFARNVERYVRNERNTRMVFRWFHQSNNKLVRIFTNAADVQNMIIYPEDWAIRWPVFHKHVTSYMAAGGNAHDDAPDALTMIIEEERKKATGSRKAERTA